MNKYNTEFNIIPPSIEEGVIVGGSKDQEWLLPWWWMHFRSHNSYPVTFIDYGDLSSTALEWCKARGQVIKLELSDSFLAKRESIDLIKATQWESMHPNVWKLRYVWFKKIFALLSTPYKKTVWIDLDCQVSGSLKPLFALSLQEGGIGCAPESPQFQAHNLKKGRMLVGQTMYNSGVIVYNYKSKIVEEWAKQAIELNHLFCSEQDLLVHTLFTQKIPFVSLPSEYNWTVERGFKPNVVIFHFWGDAGKSMLKRHIVQVNANMGFNLTFDDKIALVGESSIVKF